MNSSSSSSLPFPAPLQEKYDVFLSFRGEDTRDTFTSHLHKALLRKNIDTYIDHRLERGDEIAPALLKAIERSKIALVIFSKDYASSTWCLKELVHILGRRKSHGQIVIPIFYRIDPSDVRKQNGTYALEDRPMNEVANWRTALEEAANISGFHDSRKTGTEADFVEKVVLDVKTKLIRESSSYSMDLVGIETKIEQIESLLCFDSPGVCCVGIWGMGGIGKTTLADAVFHRQSSKFEASCFLANVRENSEQTNGLNDLRNTLVRELLKDKDVNIKTPSMPRHIQDRLRRTKALIVLDDVNARKQLGFLVGDRDRFCQGSRIIITSRHKGLLEQKVDHAKIFNVEGLGYDEALQLFHSHAFGNKSPTTDYTELSREVVDYVKGNPLALIVMGSSFCCRKSKQEWEVEWKKVKKFPNEEIDQALRISYEGLGKHEKEIFLDIVCFHKGRRRNYVEECLDGCDFQGKAGIDDLIDRSLISISKWNNIEMHDLMQEMGRAIAQEERSRLYIAKDIYQVLTNNQRDGHVQAISLDWFEIERLRLKDANFEKMCQLRWLRVGYYHLLPGISSLKYPLIVSLLLGISSLKYPLIVSLDFPNSLRYLDWYKYPLKSLPSKFSAQNLLVLKMSNSEVIGARLWNEDQNPVYLKLINLEGCKHLTEVPDLSESLEIEHIDLSGCESLVEIPSYFQHLGKLTYLKLGGCTNLKNLPEMPCNLEFLDLSGTAIEELPSSVWSHEKISHLDIKYCRHLKSLPSNSCKLKLSNSFILQGCQSLCELEFVGDCKSLATLTMNIWKSNYLESLDLGGCSTFQHFLKLSESLNLSVVFTYLVHLTLLGQYLSWTSLNARIKQAARLSYLRLINCMSFEYICSRVLREKHIFSKCPGFKEFKIKVCFHARRSEVVGNRLRRSAVSRGARLARGRGEEPLQGVARRCEAAPDLDNSESEEIAQMSLQNGCEEDDFARKKTRLVFFFKFIFYLKV